MTLDDIEEIDLIFSLKLGDSYHYARIVSELDCDNSDSCDYTLTSITPSENQSEVGFGFSTDIDGDTMVVGMVGGNGSVFVYERINGSWSETAVLKASDGADGDHFGISLGVSGNNIIVGAPFHDLVDEGISKAGAAYLYEKVDNVWNTTESKKFTSLSPYSFGAYARAVDIDGDRLVINDLNEVEQNQQRLTDVGSVVVYEKLLDTWTLTEIIDSPVVLAEEAFGFYLLDGDRLVVSAPYSNNEITGDVNVGAVYIFEYLSNTWIETAHIMSDDQPKDVLFGNAISIHNDRLLVGAPQASGETSDTAFSGAVYVFEKDQGSWSQVQKILPPNPVEFGHFGYAVGQTDNTFFIGEPYAEDSDKSVLYAGAVYTYKENNNSWQLDKTLKLENPSQSANFGHTISISDSLLLISAPYLEDTDSGNANTGKVFYYDR